jgi:hypothetical protein
MVEPHTDGEGVRAMEHVGRYRLVKRVGSGAFATVWLANDDLLDAPVAIKILADNWAHQADVHGRFLEEARLLRRIDHPRVVRVMDIGELEDGRPYFVMDYAEGGSLADRLRAGQLDIAEAVRHGVDAARALAILHEYGVVHRDVTPGNLLFRISRHGEHQLVVADLGMAKALVDASKLTQVVGTPSYMAPEQAQGRVHDIDQRTDVFGLGATLYAILTGHGPFHADDPEVALERARRCAVETPKNEEESIPPELIRVAMKALSAAPEDRYQTVDELARDVEAFQRGGGWFSTRRYEPGAVIVEEGEPGSAAYVLVEGKCEVFKNVDGVRVKLRTLEPGDVFGETAVFTRKPRTATVVAIDPVVVKIVTRESLERELDRSPWMGAFVRAVAERFREADEKLSSKR